VGKRISIPERRRRDTDSFAAFSVSTSNEDAVVRYIRTQDSHHKKMDYKSELIALLKNTASHTIRNMFSIRGLCRAYGAHDPMHILPTALPWANLPVRLRRVELPALLQRPRRFDSRYLSHFFSRTL
jgi:hypothetical protein